MTTETTTPTADAILEAVCKALTVDADEVQFLSPIQRTVADDGWVTVLSVPEDYHFRKLTPLAMLLASALHRSQRCIVVDGDDGNPRLEVTVLDRHPEPVGA